MLAIRLPPKIEKRLSVLAKKTGRTKTYYAREAIIERIQDLEDYYLAEERMKDYDPAKAIPIEEVMKRYGMDP